MKNLKLSDAAVDAQGDGLAPLFNSGFLRIYSGTQPSSTSASASGTLLAELRFASTGIATSVNGMLTANAIADVAAVAAGTASWYRVLTTGGVVICDGSIGTTVDYDLVMASTSISQGATVGITDFIHIIPKAAA